ncbi:hypothetical protein [Sandaracinobacteroides saxicola]|uniref:Lipoprotein n=1 Tax=Sandaracinobacteroides saxicola TaxID=2759707 RepID=A0A7G5IGR0_9SPHN|nr:hypothetical protein [Sandaracinobacteroides saxicola]QMW22552.1 hypothetical protein H3309_14700 [Sandaracinobacteroides saxicola]
MKPLLPLLLLALLAGCATAREAAGAFNQMAERGVGIQSAAQAEAAADREAARASNALPGGLGGDKANAAHAGAPVTPQQED